MRFVPKMTQNWSMSQVRKLARTAAMPKFIDISLNFSCGKVESPGNTLWHQPICPRLFGRESALIQAPAFHRLRNESAPSRLMFSMTYACA